MKKETLIKIIQEEIARELQNTKSELTEVYDLDQVKYSDSIRKQVDKLVELLQKSTLSKVAVASILNDIIFGLGMDRTQMTMYMSMIKQYRKKYQF